MGMMMAPLALVVAAVGYWVLLKASKEQGGLKQLGNIIGWVTVILSAVALIIGLISPMVCRSGRGHMGMMGMSGCYGSKMMDKGDMGKGMMEGKHMKGDMKDMPMKSMK